MLDYKIIVPVKGNSERVKKKNLAKFSNKSLLLIKLEQLLAAGVEKNTIISSESDEVLDIASKMGFQLHARDAYYSTSHIPMTDVYRYLASEVSCEHIAWVNVTNPLFDASFLTRGLELASKKILSKKFDCLLTCKQVKEYFVTKGGTPINFERMPWPRSQDLDPLFSITFALSVIGRDQLIESGTLVGKNPYLFVCDPENVWDIDDPLDFKFCEFLYESKRVSK